MKKTMSLQEAFEKGKTEYEKPDTSTAGKLQVKQPADLKSIDNNSVTEIFVYHEFSGELPQFKDYPNLEKVSVSSKYKAADLKEQDLSGISNLSVFADYSESTITFDADGLKELYLNVQNNNSSDQVSLFGNDRPLIDLHNLNNLETLRLVHVKNCEIIWPENTESVKQLLIEDGNFSDYSFIERFHNVENLRLSSCKISDCVFLRNLLHLSVLDLSHNNIKVFHKPLCHLSFLDLRSNITEDENIYSFADEVVITDRDELIHKFKEEINRYVIFSYKAVETLRNPDHTRPDWKQKSIDSKTDEELYSDMLSLDVSCSIARIIDPSNFQNKRAKLTYEELEKIALDILPFITVSRYRIERIRGRKRYVRE